MIDTTVLYTARERYRREADTTLRFGQWYINTYRPAHNPWPELFYERDDDKAWQMIIDDVTARELHR